MDNTDDTKWQQVGRTKLRTKAQKEEAIKKMPKVQDFGHAKMSAMMYEGDMVVPSDPLKDSSNTQDSKSDLGPKPKPLVKKKPKKNAVSEPKYNFKSLNDALKQEDLGLEEKLLQIQNTFPDNPNMWLKSIAAHINVSLRCPDDKPTFDGHSFDYPLCNLNKSTYNTMMKIYGSDCDDTIAPLIFQHCITTMLDCIARDIPCLGYKLCIQALAHSHPEVCCQDLKKSRDKILSMQNVPKQCLSLLWAVGQTAFKSQKCGMRVWLELMLPTLHIKNTSQYSMTYIEDIMKDTNGKASDYFGGMLEAEQFLIICRWRFDPNSMTSSKHATQVQERLTSVYPVFRGMMMTGSNNIRQIFVCILETMKIENQELSFELTEIASKCLERDQHCFKLWRDLYTTSLPRSSSMLLLFLGDWDAVMRKMPRKSFAETIRAFHNTNVDAVTRSDKFANLTEFKDVQAMCENIISRLSEPVVKTTPFFKLLFIASLLAAFAFLVGHVTFDIEQHGGVWERSNTYKFLKSKGIITAVSHVSTRVRHFTDIVSSWVGVNVPYYWKGLCDVLGPYLQVLGHALSSLLDWIVDVTAPIKTWLIIHTKDTYQQVSDLAGKFLLQFLHYLDIVLGYLYVIAAWCFDRLVTLYQTIFSVYSGETSWEEIREECIKTYSYLLAKAKNMGQAFGNYIAPDQP